MLTTEDTKIITKIVTQAIALNNAIQTEQLQKEFNNIYRILAEHDKHFEKVEQEIGQLRDDIYLFKDDITGVVRDIRDELAVLTGYKDDIEDHEIRINKLEHKVFTSKN